MNKKRPIDLLVKQSLNWWSKDFVLIKKAKIKNWQAVFIMAILAGFIIGITWSIRANIHTESDAGFKDIKAQYKKYKRKYKKDSYKKAYQIVKEVKKKYNKRYQNMKRIYPVMKKLPRPSDNEIEQGLGYYPEVAELGYTLNNFHQAWKDYKLYRRYKKYKKYRKLRDLYQEEKEDREEELAEKAAEQGVQACDQGEDCESITNDLKIGNIRLEPNLSSYPIGSKVEVFARIENQGNASATTDVGLFKADYADQLEDPIKITDQEIFLDKNQIIESLDLGYFIVEESLREEFYIQAYIDPYDDIFEIFEHNNTFDIKVNVSEIITPPTTTPPTCAQEGQEYSLSGDPDYPDSCCQGLTQWEHGLDTRISIGPDCYNTGTEAGLPFGTCLKTQDQVCAEIENPCNSPEDCSDGQNATYPNIESFCVNRGNLCDQPTTPAELQAVCDTCPTQPNCAQAGQSIKTDPQKPDQCCDNLISWSNGEYKQFSVADKCYQSGELYAPVGEICLDCGNNVCEDWENPCNCPNDCGLTNTDYPNVQAFCASPDYDLACHNNPNITTELQTLCDSCQTGCIDNGELIFEDQFCCDSNADIKPNKTISAFNLGEVVHCNQIIEFSPDACLGLADCHIPPPLGICTPGWD
ncbi:MAG: hypothetical protein GF332_04720, partial [Candidatus Moranbacteria bacterium]|nr:hypothetical protein [Candidatus Moranbacteria bacterium]